MKTVRCCPSGSGRGSQPDLTRTSRCGFTAARMRSAVSTNAAGRSQASFAIGFGVASMSVFQVALGKRNPPLQGEMNGVGNQGERELVLNRPEFFECANTPALQLRFHRSMVLVGSWICKRTFTRFPQFFPAVFHHFILNE